MMKRLRYSKKWLVDSAYQNPIEAIRHTKAKQSWVPCLPSCLLASGPLCLKRLVLRWVTNARYALMTHPCQVLQPMMRHYDEVVRGWTSGVCPTGHVHWVHLQYESLLFAIRFASRSKLRGQEVNTPRTLGLRWLGL